MLPIKHARRERHSLLLLSQYDGLWIVSRYVQPRTNPVGPNEEELRKLRLRAIKELGIKISTERLYNELLKVCNPKQFTGAAYNKDLLALANQVYPSIRQNADNISALESIRKQADELYRYKNKKEKEKRDRKQDERERDLIFIYTLLLCFIIFLLFYFLHHILHITC